MSCALRRARLGPVSAARSKRTAFGFHPSRQHKTLGFGWVPDHLYRTKFANRRGRDLCYTWPWIDCRGIDQEALEFPRGQLDQSLRRWSIHRV